MSEAEVSQLVDFEGRVKQLGLVQPFPGFVELYPHQLVTQWQMKKNKRVILSLDKGAGKTLVVLAFFEQEEIHRNIPGFTVLILCPEKGMGSYIRDIKKLPGEQADKIQLVYGDKAQRERQWRTTKPCRYFICTYDTFLSDTGRRSSKSEVGRAVIAPKWAVDNSIDAVVCDEYHRKFRRHTSKTFEVLAKLFRYTEYVFPMSGSAVSKGPQDLYAALHIVDPKLWSSYWKYVYTWCEVDDNGFGRAIIGPRTDRVEQWRAAVRPYVVHIKAEMISGMPPKTRDFLDVKMDLDQAKLYYEIRDQQFSETEDGEFIFAGNTLTKINLFRQILICPKAINEAYDVGAGIKAIHEDALDGGICQYAIFTPFRAPIPHLAAWLRSNGVRVWELHGGIGLEEQTRRIDAWRASLRTATPENPSAIISTVKYAESWEIPEARYGYFLGEEWDPEDNKQAEDRLRRLISIGMTYIQYCRFLNTYQEEIISLLLDKGANVRMMFKNWADLKRYIDDHHTVDH